MKVVKDEIDISAISKGTKKGVEIQKMVDFGNEIFPTFKTLVGSGRGKLIDVREELPQIKDWPTREMYDDMSKPERLKFVQTISSRIKPLLSHLNELIFKSSRNRKMPYKSSWIYSGNGQVVLWWRFIKTKEKMKDDPESK